MPELWSDKLLGDVIELKRGYDLPASKRVEGDTPIISSSGPSGLHNQAKIAAPGVVTGRYGTIGQVFYVTEDFWPLNTTLYVRDFKGNNPRFVSYFLRGIDFLAYSDKAAVPGVNRNHLHEAEVRVPDLDTQKQIVRILASLDDKIELNRRMNETLEEMARALFRDWFVDFGPTRRQMEGATDPAAIMGHAFPPQKAATLAPLFPAELGDYGLPEGWNLRPLNSVVDQQKQSVKPDQNLDEVFEHFSLPAFDKAKWPSRELGSEIKSNKTAVPLNALLVSKLNPRIERVWVPQLSSENRQICSNEFLCFKPALGLGLATVEALFRSVEMREKMASMVTGTSNSHQRVPPKVLMQADVLLPDTCAAAFETLAVPLLNKRQANEQENQTLAEMRDLLLPQLMSGEIRLKDVAKPEN